MMPAGQIRTSGMPGNLPLWRKNDAIE